MKLILLKIRLAIHLGIFSLQLGANHSKKTKPIIVSLFVFGIVLCVVGISWLSQATQQLSQQIITISALGNTQAYNEKKLQYSALQTELQYWKSIETQQPNSQAVLVNISQLYEGLNDPKSAQLYRDKARAINPNSPLFSTN